MHLVRVLHKHGTERKPKVEGEKNSTKKETFKIHFPTSTQRIVHPYSVSYEQNQ